MKRVFLISPYSGDVEANVAYARRCMKYLLTVGEGFSVFAGHLLYTQVLDDNVPAERDAGMRAAYAWLAESQLAYVFLDRGVSRGMRADVDAAQRLAVPIVYRFLDMEWTSVNPGPPLCHSDQQPSGDWLHIQGLPHADYACATCHATKQQP